MIDYGQFKRYKYMLKFVESWLSCSNSFSQNLCNLSIGRHYHPCAANDQPPTRKRSGKAIVDLFHTPLQHGDVLKLMANAASIARLRRSYDALRKWKFNASKMDDKLSYC